MLDWLNSKIPMFKPQIKRYIFTYADLYLTVLFEFV